MESVNNGKWFLIQKIEKPSNMPKLGPIKRKQLIKYLRQLGFEGPYGQGRSHSVMIKGDLTLTVPNKHGSGVINDVGLLKRILNQAGIDVKTWESL